MPQVPRTKYQKENAIGAIAADIGPGKNRHFWSKKEKGPPFSSKNLKFFYSLIRSETCLKVYLDMIWEKNKKKFFDPKKIRKFSDLDFVFVCFGRIWRICMLFLFGKRAILQ